MRHQTLFLIVLVCLTSLHGSDNDSNMTILPNKHLKRLKKLDGGVKLVNGRNQHEGNVEILYNGRWGAICDDEWDVSEALVICRQLGYKNTIVKATSNSYFAKAKRRFWMDNVYCTGTEQELTDCKFDGWGNSDCTDEEAAGVICQELKMEINQTKSSLKSLKTVRKLRLKGGRTTTEGRVEYLNPNGKWDVICAEGWSLKEALVVCKTLSLGYAADAIQTTYFGGQLLKTSLTGVRCQGNESSFTDCFHDPYVICNSPEVAAVSCTWSLPDIVIDHQELANSAYLQDLQMFYMQCAMEENCAASSAYEVQKKNGAWHLETRRLLKFTAKILNIGNADFRPSIPKHLWEWHMCHMHYHSMEIFATFNIYNFKGDKVAEGHKASFCLEDNKCLHGVKPKYACANYGDQGISVNCSDIYKHTVDCQWVDISDLQPGDYKIQVAANPEYKVAEMDYTNNAAFCDFIYLETGGFIRNCILKLP
ncbi:hypothetical protein ABEB36_012577 [Hypothenemus hampei]|uniref:protein-lysine 6-oxidase n=1 Tax=Hypothenemus hampei TaxID=57062 RepID=A0ABD1EBT2_HYPHA